MVFSESGVLEGISAGKGYVDMSTVDEETSTRIGDAVTAKGGRFVEVRTVDRLWMACMCWQGQAAAPEGGTKPLGGWPNLLRWAQRQKRPSHSGP